jgi:hypothetical protein
MLKRTLLFFHCLFCFSSCRNEHSLAEKNDNVLKTEFYSNGSVKLKVYERMGDTVELISYDSAGLIKKATTIFNSSHREKRYNGYSIAFNKNGIPAAKENIKDGQVFGRYETYYANGKLKSIQLISYDDSSTYWREYDSTSNQLIVEGGFPVISAVKSYSFSIGDTIENIVTMLYFPDWDINMSITEAKGSKKRIVWSTNTISVFESKGYGKELTIKVPATEKGVFSWDFNIDIYDRTTHSHMNEIKKFEFTVK